ncbi:MAG: aldehyde dehydrogenase family protein [Nitrospinae bacterium]|nr:aldehyde dehydrogenase family protein [Nitrospinota bacterium]
MSSVFLNFIGGKWAGSRSGKTYENRNPADWREVVGIFPDSGPEDIDSAVRSAREAFPSWKNTPAPKRAEVLFRAGELLSKKKSSFAVELTREMGKILKEAEGDVREAVDMAFYIGGEGRRFLGHTTPSELKDKWCMSMRVPLGVVAAITPWNFPMAVPSWKIFPALLAGNAVVLKPAPAAPLSALRLVEILEQAGLPPGALNLVCGTGPELGASLARHPGIDMVAFTGSNETGKKVSESCGKNMKRFSLELGGKNAVIVDEAADLDLALEGVLWGAFGTTGQRCTSTSRLILHKNIAEKFTDMLVEKAWKLKCGNGLDERNQIGPLINESQLNRVRAYVDIGLKEGANLLLGGERCMSPECANGWFFKPTIFSGVNKSMRVAREEIFGPVLSILIAGSLEEAMETANDCDYGLSASIYSKDINKALSVAGRLETGISYVNSPTIGAEVHLPFGGVKGTGNGYRDGGPTVLDAYTEWKTIYVDFSGRLQKAQMGD